MSNVNVSHCTVRYFEVGIYLYASNGNNIAHNTLEYNVLSEDAHVGAGMYLSGSSNNNITDNDASSTLSRIS